MSDDRTAPEQPRFTPEDEAAVEADLAAFARDEAARLGLNRPQWQENPAPLFTADQRPHTTMLMSGLSLAHDQLAAAACEGIGYKVEVLDAPNQESLQFGKEFGNRGQCNPTWFTVGNLVKHLVKLRDHDGVPTQQIIDSYIFVTAGGCGPCRFGMYVTEYRKALRDAGFDGFRVLTFQMAGGVQQATGKELGLKIDMKFSWAVVRALMAGDVVNLVGYRIRPYEVTPGATDIAIAQCKRLLADTFRRNGSITLALVQCRRILSKVAVDRSRVKPVVSIIGEFWAMTTEGDGNYHLQQFLEAEGAEVDIQPVTNWLLFLVWEAGYDTRKREDLREFDASKKGLAGKDPAKKQWLLKVGYHALHGMFQTFAKAIGLENYHLPDMQRMAEIASQHYNNDVRGGEGHLEVGKVIHFVVDHVNHLTISVKPFGCMPSSGVSDGVQSAVVSKYPEALFLPIETTGDQQVNAHSRVQMMLFKARQKARGEFDKALAETGLTEAEFVRRLEKSRRWRGPLGRPAHRGAGTAANLVYALG
jgi:predicted nucleotide-binding protein (sugar kinase/HSP70/actin superfamily)